MDVQKPDNDRKYHYAILCVSACGFLDIYSTQALYPALSARFGVGPAGAGSLITATTTSIAISSLFSGFFAEKIGSHKAIFLGLILLTTISFLTGFMRDWHLLLMIRILQGLIIPFVLSSLLAFIHQTFIGRKALSASTIYVSGTIIGGMAGRYLPALFFSLFGWTKSSILFSGVHLILFIAVVIFLPSETLTTTSRNIKFNLNLLRQTWTKSLKIMFISGFCLLFSQAAVFTYIVLRLSAHPFNLGHAALGALYLVFLPSLILIRFIPWLRKFIETRFLLLSTMIVCEGGLLLTIPNILWVIITGLTIFSVSIFTLQTILANEVGSDTSSPKAVSAGAYLFFYYLGGSFGAFIPAFFWPLFGWNGCLALIFLVQLACFFPNKNYWYGRQSSLPEKSLLSETG